MRLRLGLALFSRFTLGDLAYLLFFFSGPRSSSL